MPLFLLPIVGAVAYIKGRFGVDNVTSTPVNQGFEVNKTAIVLWSVVGLFLAWGFLKVAGEFKALKKRR